jgi:hypothetical protein
LLLTTTPPGELRRTSIVVKVVEANPRRPPRPDPPPLADVLVHVRQAIG